VFSDASTIYDISADKFTEGVDRPAQFLAAPRHRVEHDHCGAFEIVAPADVVDVAVGAVGIDDDGLFQGVDDGI
jgi:hypothetical protein